MGPWGPAQLPRLWLQVRGQRAGCCFRCEASRSLERCPGCGCSGLGRPSLPARDWDRDLGGKGRGLDGAHSPVGSRALPQDLSGLSFGQVPCPSPGLLPGLGPLLQSLGRGRPKAGEVDRVRWVWHRALWERGCVLVLSTSTPREVQATKRSQVTLARAWVQGGAAEEE